MHKGTKKPVQNKKRRQKDVTTVTVRGPQLYPTRTRNHLNYADEIDLTIVAGVMNVYTFNANAIFDPDQTGTGHQPLGSDQYAADYNRYLVTGLSYEVSFSNPATSQSHHRCAVKFQNGSTVSARPAMFELQNGPDGTVGTSGPPLHLRGHVDLTKVNAIPGKYRMDDRYSSLVTGNPTEVMYLHVAVYGNTSSTCRIIVKLRYTVEYFDPETPSSSIEVIARRENQAELVRAHFAEKKRRILAAQKKQIQLKETDDQ